MSGGVDVPGVLAAGGTVREVLHVRLVALALAALVGCGHSAPVVQEDSPSWDCPTMGNKVCGPDAPAWMRDGNPNTGPAS